MSKAVAKQLQNFGASLSLTTVAQESRVDSRLLAGHLGNQHKHVIALIEKYAEPFSTFGKVLFEKAPSAVSITGQRERFALLNEDQAFFLLTMSRNSDHVVNLKVKLVQAFSEARLVANQRQTEYLPTYHRLHDTVHQLAGQSPNEKFVHINLNRLVNKTAGLEAGQRPTAGLSQQAILIVAQDVATQAMQGATDHHDGYQLAKRSLSALAAVVNVHQLATQHGGQ
ncbi:MAG: Rha family transcriptional regulator [Polaromonas sp.]